MSSAMQSKLEVLNKWADASRQKPGFTEALRSLLHYAAAEILRKNAPEIIQISPEKAFFTILPHVAEPLASWNAEPGSYEKEILAFAASEHMASIPKTEEGVFDLRGVKCPECSMRARLLTAEQPDNAKVTFLLDAGSPAENVPASLVADGHSIEKREKKENFWQYLVQKGAR